MTTLFGVLLLVGGFTVLAVVRPWQSQDRGRKAADPPSTGGFRSTRPRPGPGRPAAVSPPAARRPRPGQRGRQPEAGTGVTSTPTAGTTALLEPITTVPSSGDPRALPPLPGDPRTRPSFAGDPRAVPDAAPVVALKPRPGARRADRFEHVPVRHHRVETIQRGRRVPNETVDLEIVLPEWLGPVSGPDFDAAPVRARHAG